MALTEQRGMGVLETLLRGLDRRKKAHWSGQHRKRKTAKANHYGLNKQKKKHHNKKKENTHRKKKHETKVAELQNRNKLGDKKCNTWGSEEKLAHAGESIVRGKKRRERRIKGW